MLVIVSQLKYHDITHEFQKFIDALNGLNLV